MRSLLIFHTILFFAVTAHATSPSKSLLSEIEQKATQISTIQCRFTQEKHLQMFEEVLISHGKFYFEKPDNVRWEYTSPFQTGFLLKKNAGIEWDEASGQTRTFTTQSAPYMAVVADQITAWASFDIDWLTSRYDISQLSKSPVTLELRPKSATAQEFLRHLKVIFTDDKTGVEVLELHEPGKDFTRIQFENQIINGTLSPDVFATP